MLKKIYYRYLQVLLIFSILITGIYIVLRQLVLQQVIPDIVSGYFPALIIIFVFLTAITHYAVVQTDVERIEHKPNPELPKEEQMKAIAAIERKFINRYLLITTVKIISFLILLALYTYFNRENRGEVFRFLLNFLVIYVIYALFELIYQKIKKR